MIRAGTTSDFDQIDAFDPFSGDRASELSQGRCLVAEADTQVVAYVTFSVVGFIGRPFVHFLAVAPGHRRRGVALALLRAVEAEIGTGRLFISTEAGNGPMLSLLARDGWTPAGCVQGVNDDGSAECFFFRDLPNATPSK